MRSNFLHHRNHQHQERPQELSEQGQQQKPPELQPPRGQHNRRRRRRRGGNNWSRCLPSFQGHQCLIICTKSRISYFKFCVLLTLIAMLGFFWKIRFFNDNGSDNPLPMLVATEPRRASWWRGSNRESSSNKIPSFQDECSSKSSNGSSDIQGNGKNNNIGIEGKIKIPLIIGGSDGSGTRAFVHALQQLGVTIVTDDPTTMDFHAGLLFHHEGWPGLVQRVLVETHGSAHYDWTDLSESSRARIGPEMVALVQQLQSKCITAKEHNYRDRHTINSNKEKTKRGSTAVTTNLDIATTDISYAMKAPISMLVWPILSRFLSTEVVEKEEGTAGHQQQGRIKFLHIVRDGRDVALSSNQSPVTKFYNVTYPDHRHHPHEKQFHNLSKIDADTSLQSIKAMQLWNDWNLQVYEWGTSQQQEQHQQEYHRTLPSAGVEYLVLRSEDLLNPETRFDTLWTLSNFVGSTLSTEELCCLSRRSQVDFGTSHNSMGGGDNDRHHQQQHQRQEGQVDEEDNASSFQRAKAVRVREARVEERARAILQQEAALRERWATLDGKIAALVQREQELDQQGQEKEMATNNRTTEKESLIREPLYQTHRRRRLTTTLTKPKIRQISKPPPKMVATSFFRDYDRFQDGVAINSAQDPPFGMSGTLLQGYITMGQRLEQLWKLNEAAVAEYVPLEDIEAQVLFLQELAKEQANLPRQASSSLLVLEQSQQVQPYYGEEDDLQAVQQRYGKWKTRLAQNPMLSRILHQEGAAALRMFGYEPYCTRFLYYGDPRCTGSGDSKHRQYQPPHYYWNLVVNLSSSSSSFICNDTLQCN